MQTFPASHVLTLTGSSRQRGKAHGESLRPIIHDLLARWKDSISTACGVPADEFIRGMQASTHFLSVVEAWTPSLLEEVRGMAEGAAVGFDDLFVFQLQDEQWWYAEGLKKNSPPTPGRCSSLAWRSRGQAPSLIAQNMDMPTLLDGAQVVLRIEDEGTGNQSLVFSTAGLIALNGLNDRGIGVVCNNLGQLRNSTRGLPVAFVLRGILQQETYNKACRFLRRVPHASGQNYILGSRKGMIGLECSANRVCLHAVARRGAAFCHTNHPLANTDLHSLPVGKRLSYSDLQDVILQGNSNSRTRYDTLAGSLDAISRQEPNPAAARDLLSSHASEKHPVCCHPRDGWMTVGTSIMQLGEISTLHVCPGPPCSAEFMHFSF